MDFPATYFEATINISVVKSIFVICIYYYAISEIHISASHELTSEVAMPYDKGTLLNFKKH